MIKRSGNSVLCIGNDPVHLNLRCSLSEGDTVGMCSVPAAVTKGSSGLVRKWLMRLSWISTMTALKRPSSRVRAENDCGPKYRSLFWWQTGTPWRRGPLPRRTR